jgi:hypothetical protein
MALTVLLRAAVPLAATVLALGVAPAAAQASAGAGWSVAEVYGPANGYPDLQAVAASGRSAAWVSGESFDDLVIYRWNGKSWSALTVPASFEVAGSGTVNDSVIGASSANDMWTFPNVSTSVTEQYALQRHDGKWKIFKLGSTALVNYTAVFSPSDVWAFGTNNVSTASGYGTPYLRRYNGHAWKSASMPGDALGVSPLSATDIWAWGPTTKTLGSSTPDVVAMHWNGASWSTLAVPIYSLSAQPAVVQQLVAIAPSNLWAVEGLPVDQGTGQPEGPGLILAHWNGHKWRSVVTDTSDTGMGGLVSDGHGGVWLQAVNATSGLDEFLHYSDGSLAAVPEPTALTGLTTSVSDIALVPGTTSLWAAASLSPGAAGFDDGAILSYVG